MATFKRFEDIEAWKKARLLARQVYEASQVGAFARDFGLRDQIRRASVSVMSNIAEGFERGGASEFIHFLAIAKGSAGEVRAQLFVALDQQYMTREAFEQLYQLAAETSRLIRGLMNYLKNTEIKGERYKAPGQAT